LTERILHLTLKKKWFDLIKAGKKKEEYRDIKRYWSIRLMVRCGVFKKWDIVRFRNGYKSSSPTMDVECKGVRIGKLPHPYPGAGMDVFIISLGEVLHRGEEANE
jgi:hypothetical protein